MQKDSGPTADSPLNRSLAFPVRAGDGVLLPKVTDAWIDGKLSVRDLIRISNSPIRKEKQETRKVTPKSRGVDDLVRTTRSDFRWWVIVRVAEFAEGLGIHVDDVAKRRQILEMVLEDLPDSLSPYANKELLPRVRLASRVDRGRDLRIYNDPEITKLFDAWQAGQLTIDEILLAVSGSRSTNTMPNRNEFTEGELRISVRNVRDEIKASISRSLLTRTVLYCDDQDILDTVKRQNVYDALQRWSVDRRWK